MGLSLSVTQDVQAWAKGILEEGPINGFGFDRKIFGFRIKLGTFWKLEWVFEGETDVDFKAYGRVWHNLRHGMTLSLKNGLQGRSLQPPGYGSGGQATFDLVSLEGGDDGVHAFFGIRPAAAIVAQFGRRGREGNVGAKLGLRCSAVVKFKSPHNSYSGGGSTIGKCDKCHRLRGQVSAVGKDLSQQYLKNGVVLKENILISKLFDIGLGTVCADAVPCGGYGVVSGDGGNGGDGGDGLVWGAGIAEDGEGPIIVGVGSDGGAAGIGDGGLVDGGEGGSGVAVLGF